MNFHDPYYSNYGTHDDGSRQPRPRSTVRDYGGYQRYGGGNVGGAVQQLCPGCNVNVCTHYCPNCYPDNMLLMLCSQCSYNHIHPMRPLALPRSNRVMEDFPKFAADSSVPSSEVNPSEKRNSFHVLEMECPHAKVASVIGTRGVVVKEINRRTGCFISINQAFPDGHPRIITLKGIYENVMEAQKMILSVIEHGPTALDPQKSFSAGIPGAEHGSAMIPPKIPGTSISVPCPLDKVGLVIGTRGAVIKEIIRRSKAHIFVAEETLLVAGEVCRMIEISGADKEVELGKQLVHIVLLHGPNAMDMAIGYPSPPNPSIGSNSTTNVGSSSGFTIDAPEFMPEGLRRPPGLNVVSGTMSAFNSAHTSPNLTPTSPPPTQSFVEAKAEIECSYEKVGVLIGFRGVVIKDIMQRSGTTINIIEDTVESFSRIVEICGQRANVAHAKILVQAVIEFGASALSEEISVLTRAINEKSTKRSTSRPPVEIHRVEFPEDKIGLMIGSKGSMVKQIMDISRAKILISDRRTDMDKSFRIVEIKGDAEAIGVAKTLIDSLINLEPHFQTVASKQSNSIGSTPTPTDQCMEMHLPADKVGILIGVRGYVIKEIMRISGTRISINADYTDEKIRIVLIRGSRDAVVNAHSIMVDVLKNGYGRLFPSEHGLAASDVSLAENSLEKGYFGSLKSWPPLLEDDVISHHSVSSTVKIAASGNRGEMISDRFSESTVGSSTEYLMPTYWGEQPISNPRRNGLRLPPNYNSHDCEQGYIPTSAAQFSSSDTMESSPSTMSGGKDESCSRSPLLRPRSVEKEVPFLSVIGDRGKRFSFADLLEEDGKGADNYWDQLLVENSKTLWKSDHASLNSNSGSNSIDFDRLTPDQSGGTTGSRTPTEASVASTESRVGGETSIFQFEQGLLNFSFFPKADAASDSEIAATIAENTSNFVVGDDETSEIVIDVPCPMDKLGQVIGSRGSVIKEIGRRSGANVSVRKDPPIGESSCLINVRSSSQKAVDIAKELIGSVIEVGPSIALDGIVCFKKVFPKPESSSGESNEGGGVASHPNRKVPHRPKV